MSRFAITLLLGSLAVATSTRSVSHLRRGKQFGKMNPEAVAHTLAAVEGKWLTEAVAFTQCNASDTTCQEDTIGEFKKSCQTVVGAIIKSSNGDKSIISEYLGDICEQPELHDWKKSFCGNFASGLTGVLTEDTYVNRDDLPVDTICANFLTRGFLKQAAKEEIDRAEKEKQKAIAAQEEEAKKEAEAAAQAAEAKEREAAARAEAAKAAADVAAKMRAEVKAKADETSNTTASQSAADSPNTTEVAVNSTASQSSPTVNSTANASKDSVVANATVAPAAPAQNTTEVVVNDTSASPAANGTAALDPALAPSGIKK